jgi:plastocyanin
LESAQTPELDFFRRLAKEIATMSCMYRNLTAVIVVVGVALAGLVLASNSARAADWGSLKGRFVYGDAVPAPVKLTIDKDTEVCGKHDLVDQSLEVSSTGGVANVVVWVRSKLTKAQVNPKYAKTADAKVPLDNHNCHFEPHVVGVRIGQTLLIKNSDPVAHNTKVDGTSTQFNQLIPASSSVEVSIDGPENLPAPVACSIHNWMKAWMVVRPNPYFAISDKNGNFEIKDLPAGEWEFQVWQEKSGYVTDAGPEAKWAKGRVKWTIEADKTTDLGEMKLGAAQFNK